MEFRKAGMEDLALVAEYRKKMIVDSGQKDTGIDKELEEYTREKMEDGSLVEWLGASAVGKPVYQKYGFKVADDLLEMNVPKEKEK